LDASSKVKSASRSKEIRRPPKRFLMKTVSSSIFVMKRSDFFIGSAQFDSYAALARPRDARLRSESYPFDADYEARRTFEFRTKRRCIGSPPPPSPRPLLRPNRPVTRILAPRKKKTACGSDGIKSGLVTISALARPLSVSHILGTMREILPGIFTWGSTYADRPWDLNGYAIRLEGCTVLVDPPAPQKTTGRALM
jgi:hypothetical protein